MSTRSYTVTKRYEGPSARDAVLPSGRLVRIEVDVILPAAATRAQVLEWVKFTLGWGSLANDNPLSEHDIDVDDEPVLSDTGVTSDRLIQRNVALRA